jgi:hypothetical protein
MRGLVFLLLHRYFRGPLMGMDNWLSSHTYFARGIKIATFESTKIVSLIWYLIHITKNEFL